MESLVNAVTTRNPFLGGKLHGYSTGRGFGALKGFGNIFFGDKILETSIGRGFGALQGLVNAVTTRNPFLGGNLDLVQGGVLGL